MRFKLEIILDDNEIDNDIVEQLHENPVSIDKLKKEYQEILSPAEKGGYDIKVEILSIEKIA